MRSEIIKGCKAGREEIRGIGIKFKIVGIQGEDNIGNLEALYGIKQAPNDKSGTVDFIPFQIQEPKARGDVKRLPYLKYFLGNKETQRISCCVRSFHPSFEMRETLISFMRRKPKSP
jgi:hypothetical protein